jgi:cytochrome c5
MSAVPGRRYDLPEPQGCSKKGKIMRTGQALAVALLLVATLVAVTLFGADSGVGSVSAASAAPDAKAVFLAQKCNLCHAVSAAGIERQTKSEKVAGPDLTTATAKHDKAFLTRFIKKEETIDGKKHGKEWKGTDLELGAVIDWLKEAKK